jgi:uncharacterized membrane protein
MVAITGTLIVSVLVLGFLGFQLVSLSAVVASWLAVAAGIVAGIGLAYTLVDEELLDVFFSTEEFQIISSVLVGVVAGFVVWRLVEAVLATFGLLVALLVGVAIAVSAVFSPAYLVSGLATGIGLLADLLGIINDN